MGDLSGLYVLIVDDNADSREITTIVLEQAGALVKSVDSAERVLPLLAQCVPDLLISDVKMPRMSGYMLIESIRQLPEEKGGTVLAIALTVYAGEPDRQRAISAGFQQHLIKPIDPEVLVQAILDLLHTRGR